MNVTFFTFPVTAVKGTNGEKMHFPDSSKKMTGSKTSLLYQQKNSVNLAPFTV